MNYHQATHPCVCLFRVPEEEPLGGTSLAASRRMLKNAVSGF